MKIRDTKRGHLGIKQPDEDVDVTGTVVMMRQNQNDADESLLKKSEHGLILFPQPHDDPNDPLNWPIWKRDLCLLIIGCQTFLGGGQTPILAAGFSKLEKEFHKPLPTLQYLVGAYMLSLGVGSVFASPTAILYGKRLVYLLGILLFLGGALWAGAADSFGNLMGARVLMGFGVSPTESLPSATIAEIYFAHERAYRVGLYTMLLLGGKNIIPLLSGLVLQYLDRHWLFWIESMFLGATLITTFLFVPDTFWDRSPVPSKRSQEETDAAREVEKGRENHERPNEWARSRQTTTNSISLHANDQQSLATSASAHSAHVHGIVDESSTAKSIEEASEETINKKTYFKELALFSGRHTKDSWWMVFLRPFVLYTYPPVLFGSLIYSLLVIWLIVISETISAIFEGQGYNYTLSTVGLFYISPFVGSVLGSVFTGILSDRLSRLFITQNYGVYEPEFRLVMLLVSTIFILIGIMGYGWSSQEEDAWIVPILFFGFVAFGLSMASTTSITYTVDCYKMFAAESLVSFNFAKNLLGFVFSLFNNAFMDSRGSKTTFVVYGCVQIFVSLFGIPLYIYGKKIRKWTDDKELLRLLYHVENQHQATK